MLLAMLGAAACAPRARGLSSKTAARLFDARGLSDQSSSRRLLRRGALAPGTAAESASAGEWAYADSAEDGEETAFNEWWTNMTGASSSNILRGPATVADARRSHAPGAAHAPKAKHAAIDGDARHGFEGFLFNQRSATFSTDWLHCIKTWHSSFVLRRIANPLAALMVWSSIVAAWGAARGAPVVNMGTSLHTLVGGALSLLLVFRTNTAYNRYWEGSQIFDKLSSQARDLADFVGVYRCEVGPARAERVAVLLRAFPMALQLHLQGFRFAARPGDHRCLVDRGVVLRLYASLGGPADGSGAIEHASFLAQLRGQPDVSAALGMPTDTDAAQALAQMHWLKFGGRAREPFDGGVSIQELAAYYAPLQLWRALGGAGDAHRERIALAANVPLAIASMLAREAKAVPYTLVDFTSRERLWMLSRVAALRATISASERIVQTPVPLHYARHTSRFLSVWCFTLPVCLQPLMPPILLPVVVGLVAWALLGLREIGLLIENPFRRSLQLTMVTDTLAAEIYDIFALHKDVQPSCEEQLKV
ncbi:hypothetical protein M885DRAFT_618892 [Pelagophyceae sp. CCMP2097]|nr:hypothetical protein M885DRAFT_618892 [Pelagophyceae sp. CCMP2097]